jgi:hypothetical protein
MISFFYLMSVMPPIRGSGFKWPLTALTIPKIRQTNMKIYPTGQIINQPKYGIIPRILTRME